MPEAPKKTFTGIQRKRQTSKRVLLTDYLARFVITFGGIGTIAAVLMVCVVLIVEVWPLFQSAGVTETIPVQKHWAGKPIQIAHDEYGRLAFAMYEDGSVSVFRLDNGQQLYTQQLVEDRKITAWSFSDRHGTIALGFEDGSFMLGSFKFSTTFIEPGENTKLNDEVTIQQVVTHEWMVKEPNENNDLVDVNKHGVVDRIPTGMLRGHSVKFTFEKPRKAGPGPVRLVDHIATSDKASATVVWNEGSDTPLTVHVANLKTNILSGKEELKFNRAIAVQLKDAPRTSPKFVRIGALAGNVYVTWEDGRWQRFRNDNAGSFEYAESGDFVEDAQVTLAALEWVIGRETLVAGHSDGTVDGWFTVPFDGSERGWHPVFHTGPGQSKPHLWLFKEGSDELAHFYETGRMEPFVQRDNALRGVNILAPKESMIDEYVALVPVDSRKLVRAKEMPAGSAAVTAIAPSHRSRLVAVGFADGTSKVYNVTGANEVLSIGEPGDAIAGISLSPKGDTVMTVTDKGYSDVKFDQKYPAVTPGTLFGKVWYEGYEKPEHAWQSSAAGDEAEPKFGLMPMIYGTLKATFYSMIFAVPIAILAAVFTSEYLKPHIKSRIKPVIEMMASLPSVVLGFIAAIWLAPRVEQHLAGVLSCFICVPLFFLIGAYIWQMLPYATTVRWREYRFMFMLVLALPAGAIAGLFVVGPILENFAFLGDLRRFLNGANEVPRAGSMIWGWMILLLPISALLVAFLSARFAAPKIRAKAQNWTRPQAARFDLMRFLLMFGAVIGVCLLLAMLASNVMGEPRGKGSIIDAYDPRNALVVGFIMGFAVIPIIYTIAEDAMSTVPDHLRAASLGAGATPWQTAVRIVIPTAMSGLFSAVMVGLGRAVGETMIVLMAAGGTAVMEPNLFNGFRTLSANIATELPEAPHGEAHYRILFMAALVLFAMTFVINTFAEWVRLRFRKRAYAL